MRNEKTVFYVMHLNLKSYLEVFWFLKRWCGAKQAPSYSVTHNLFIYDLRQYHKVTYDKCKAESNAQQGKCQFLIRWKCCTVWKTWRWINQEIERCPSSFKITLIISCVIHFFFLQMALQKKKPHMSGEIVRFFFSISNLILQTIK